MSDGYDRYESEGRGAGFMMGLVTGTVLGASVGMLFAPKSGSELRRQVSGKARNLRDTAAEGYRRASNTAEEWTDKAKDTYQQAKGAVSRGTEEAERYARETAERATGSSTGGTGTSGSSY